MRLARKLTLALVCGIIAVMGAYSAFQLRQEVGLSQADLQRAQRIGLAWLGTIEAVWEREGPARARELAERARERAHDITLQVLSLDASDVAKEHLSADEQNTLQAGQPVRRIHVDDDGEEWRQIYVPLRVPGSERTIVEYGEPMQAAETFIKMSHLALAAATIAVAALCGVIASGLHYAMRRHGRFFATATATAKGRDRRTGSRGQCDVRAHRGCQPQVDRRDRGTRCSD